MHRVVVLVNMVLMVLNCGFITVRVVIKIPQNLKFRKYCKRFSFVKNTERRVFGLWYTSVCGLVALEAGRLTPPQIKTMLSVVNKAIKVKKRKRKVLICSVFPRVPLTKKPLGSRMGRGKGNLTSWVFPVAPGRMLLQIYGVKNSKRAFIALTRASYKLPILTKVVLRSKSSVLVHKRLLTRC